MSRWAAAGWPRQNLHMDDPKVSQLNEVSSDGAFEVVVDGYDTVYTAVAASPTFRRLWAQHAYGGDFPEEYAHISFLTLEELRAMAGQLGLDKHGVLVDLACGTGGPGLWVASQAGASLIGIEPSATGLTEAGVGGPTVWASLSMPGSIRAPLSQRVSMTQLPTVYSASMPSSTRWTRSRFSPRPIASFGPAAG